MDLERVKRAFRRNRFECSVFETKEAAVEYLDHAINGVTVGFGDSETLMAMGISDRLALHNKVWDVQKSDHFKNGDNSFLALARKALTADVFLTSVNGLSIWMARETGCPGPFSDIKRCTSSSASISWHLRWRMPSIGQGMWRRRRMWSATISSAAARPTASTAATTAGHRIGSVMCWPFIIRKCGSWIWKWLSLMRIWDYEGWRSRRLAPAGGFACGESVATS